MGKAGRNDPCPCGSGKKYKKCHLAADEDKESATQNNLSLIAPTLDDEDFEFWENNHEHRAMSMWAAIPYWMEFLERIGLVAAPVCRDILKSLSPILESVSQFAEENGWKKTSVA